MTLLGGDGGTGKSLLALQLACAVATDGQWLGRPVSSGGVVFVSAEDDEAELQRRTDDIRRHDDKAFSDLHRLTLRSLAGEDALLARLDRQTGAMVPTGLFAELDRQIASEMPALVILDTLADMFPGNENDRSQARQFIGLLRGLAIRHECTLLLLAHPSQAGLNSGSGTSGSTGWSNSVRSRLYFERIISEGYEANPNARVLRNMKANYGPKGGEIGATWREGVFVPDATETGIDRVAGNAKAERVFLAFLRLHSAQGRKVNPSGGVAGQASAEMSRDMATVGRGSGAMGSQVQNAAFQITDFAVQVGMGTSATRALSQQLPQLLGGFGVWGAVIGGVVAVGAGLAPMLFNMGNAAEEAAAATDVFGESLSTLKGDISAAQSLHGEYVEAMKAGNRELMHLIELEAEARQAQFAIDRIGQDDARKAADEARAAQKADLDAAVDAQLNMIDQIAQTRAAMAEQQDNPSLGLGGVNLEQQLQTQQLALTVMTEEMVKQRAELDKSSAAYNLIDAQINVMNAKIKATGDLINIVKNGADGTSSAMASAAAETGGAAAWAEMANANMSAAADSATALADTDMAGTVAAAAGAAAQLANNLGVSLGIVQRLMQAGYSQSPVVFDPRDPRYDKGAAERASDFGFKPGSTSPFDPSRIANVSGAGSSGGGGSAAIDQTREAYDRLMASLDPVVAKTQDMAEATATVDAALAAHDITAAEHAKALDLIRDKYTETADAMGALKDAGGNALDSLINGTMSLSESLKQMAKDLIFATIKAELLNSVAGATSSMSLGDIIMQAIIPQHDAGGNIPMGTTAMVGERGRELVTATSSGAMVTSRVDTARQMQAVTQAGRAQATSSQPMTVDVVVHGGDLVLNDNGTISAKIRVSAQAAAHFGASNAIEAVKRNLQGWNQSIAIDGALA